MSQPDQSPKIDEKAGSLYALGAYTLWGFFPVYWKWLAHFSSIEILAHRIIWSMFFYWLLLTQIRKTPFSWLKLFKRVSSLKPITAASLLITFNWCLYIWAVNNGHILESSLGYFITPLLNVLTGKLVLKESLTPKLWLAVALATIGVLILSLQSDQVPLIALGLAFSFSTYGLIRKGIKADVFEASTAETALMALPSLGVILFVRSNPSMLAPTITASDWLLLIGSGFITGLPLLWFAQAAKRLPLSKLGFFQYIAPTFQFLLGAFIFKEPLASEKLYAFIFIWLGLAVFSWETLSRSRTPRR